MGVNTSGNNYRNIAKLYGRFLYRRQQVFKYV